jgi:hypothetical protein
VGHRDASPKTNDLLVIVLQVFFEVATGLRAYSTQRKPESLAVYVANMHTEAELDSIRDTSVELKDTNGCFRLCMQIGTQCCNHDPQQRPSANDIIQMLAGVDK